MGRSERHLKIIDLVNKNDINTQDELVKRLKSAGYKVTQATVSRDIKDLGLIKVMSDDRKYKYSYVKSENSGTNSLLLNMFKESVISIDYAQNIIVIKCITAGAQSTAAVIDKLNLPDIIGSIAGDDTVMIVVSSNYAVKGVLNKLHQLMH